MSWDSFWKASVTCVLDFVVFIIILQDTTDMFMGSDSQLDAHGGFPLQRTPPHPPPSNRRKVHTTCTVLVLFQQPTSSSQLCPLEPNPNFISRLFFQHISPSEHFLEDQTLGTRYWYRYGTWGGDENENTVGTSSGCIGLGADALEMRWPWGMVWASAVQTQMPRLS